jgi:hypothetical protein
MLSAAAHPRTPFLAHLPAPPFFAPDSFSRFDRFPASIRLCAALAPEKDAIAEKDKKKQKELMATADEFNPQIGKYKKMLDEPSKGLAEAAKHPQPTPSAAPAK